MKILMWLLIVLIVFGGLWYAWYYHTQIQSMLSPTPVPTALPTVEPTPMPTQTPTEATQSSAVGGGTYQDPQGTYLVLYPADYTVDTPTDTSGTKVLRLTKKGVTQEGATELYDGVTVVFQAVDLKGEELSSWVDDKITTVTADGTIQVTSPKKSVTVNGYSGYTYTTKGQTTTKYTVLQKDPNTSNAVVIALSVSDPQNQGYEEEADAIITSLKILK